MSSEDSSMSPHREPRESHCRCCGGYAGYGADPAYCATCRAAGEHLTTCPMCDERVPRRTVDEVCSDCEETIDELDRFAGTQQEET